MSQLTGAVVILLIAIPVALAYYVGAAMAREARKIRQSERASRRKRGDT